MHILVATLLLLASSIAAPISKSQIPNQQTVLAQHQPFPASSINPLWDCTLPNCNWGPCESTLKYSLHHPSKTCITSLRSLTNGDCAGRINGSECEGCRPVLSLARRSRHILLHNMDCGGLERLRDSPPEQVHVWPAWTRVLAERLGSREEHGL